MSFNSRISNIVLYCLKRYKWFVLALDVLITVFSLSAALSIATHGKTLGLDFSDHIFGCCALVTIRIVSFLYRRMYAKMIKFITAFDTLYIKLTLFIGSLIMLALNACISNTQLGALPYEAILIEFLITTFLISTSRVAAKKVLTYRFIPQQKRHNIAIYGCDQTSTMVKKIFEREPHEKHKVLAFFGSQKHDGKVLDGVRVYGEKHLERILTKLQIQQLVIPSQCISKVKKEELIEICMRLEIKILKVPEINKWINGSLSINQIKDIKIEDLLEREPISLDEEQLKDEIKDKVILVTGAAGSIGSEIVRQLSQLSPKKLILVDQAETPMYELEIELKEEHQFSDYELRVADIRNSDIIDSIFNAFRPQMVFHAAAYKHVPMMEKHPAEAIRANVFGTINVANAASKYRAKKFVFVSTDKAVNPTNIMGASKRIAEIYVQSLSRISETKFITTRFGNVLGSNGSVIPRFSKQIKAGGPITVTHPEITRFFMTIPEACRLVLEAGTMGRGGEIFLFDMGEPVKIADLARKMIKLSGLIPDVDIKIEYTGLRDGEKLYEELLSTKENTLPTHHPKITIAKVREYDFQHVKQMISELQDLLNTGIEPQIVFQMKSIVPEFKSKNSKWEKLDHLKVNA